MSCYHPLLAYRTGAGVSFTQLRRDGDVLNSIELPCGQCIGCRMRRASDWSLRVMHEAQMWEQNCFVTLTYGRGALPADSSLDHGDFQRFMKRVRFHVKKSVRFYMCGEYGPETQRPHYHACLFGVDFCDRKPAGKSGSGALFYESETLTKLWGHGFATVQDLVPETASYCARYIMKKVLGKDAKEHYGDRKPEYAAMSLKPGIGAEWYKKFGRSDVHNHDFVVQNGIQRRPPKYYDKLLKRSDADRLEEIGFDREKRGRAAYAENTDERRRVREVVQLAKVSTLKRSLK